MNKFHIPKEDAAYQYQFDSQNFIAKQVEKYKKIKAIDPDAILYIVNLFSEDYRGIDYFDGNGKRQHEVEKSCIRIIPNILVPTNDNETSTYFQFLVHEIKSKYETA